MRKLFSIHLLISIFFIVFTSYFVHATDRFLRTETVKDIEITGTFSLILYGGSYLDDFETIAILDYEGDEFIFQPYAREFDYNVHKGLPSEKALKEAHEFIRGHSAFLRARLRKILDEKGKIIGYELRPLYLPVKYGVSDTLEVRYKLQKQTVRIFIRPHPRVRDPRFENGAGHNH